MTSRTEPSFAAPAQDEPLDAPSDLPAQPEIDTELDPRAAVADGHPSDDPPVGDATSEAPTPEAPTPDELTTDDSIDEGLAGIDPSPAAGRVRGGLGRLRRRRSEVPPLTPFAAEAIDWSAPAHAEAPGSGPRSGPDLKTPDDGVSPTDAAETVPTSGAGDKGWPIDDWAPDDSAWAGLTGDETPPAGAVAGTGPPVSSSPADGLSTGDAPGAGPAPSNSTPPPNSTLPGGSTPPSAFEPAGAFEAPTPFEPPTASKPGSIDLDDDTPVPLAAALGWSADDGDLSGKDASRPWSLRRRQLVDSLSPRLLAVATAGVLAAGIIGAIVVHPKGFPRFETVNVRGAKGPTLFPGKPADPPTVPPNSTPLIVVPPGNTVSSPLPGASTPPGPSDSSSPSSVYPGSSPPSSRHTPTTSGGSTGPPRRSPPPASPPPSNTTTTTPTARPTPTTATPPTTPPPPPLCILGICVP